MFFFIYLCPLIEREIDNQNRFNRECYHLERPTNVWRVGVKINH